MSKPPRSAMRWATASTLGAAALTLVIFPQLPKAEIFGAPQVSFTDISPRFSARYAADYGKDYWGQYAAGGRVNNLAGVKGSNQIFYAATEWGGIWKTLDGGDVWFQLTGHVPTATWDVAVDPLEPDTVYATSFYDGREEPLSGIQVSRDGGTTWTTPPVAFPKTLDCREAGGLSQSAPREWSAFGIGVTPDASQHVYVGTSCGVAISHNSGATWTLSDPFKGIAGLSYVWDVAVQPGGTNGMGIVDVCGVEGHSRSTDGGLTWVRNSLPYPIYTTGRCSIAVSPDEPYVIFVVDDRTFGDDPNLHMLYESDDAGKTWFKLGNPYRAWTGSQFMPVIRPTKRLTFVLTNKRSDLAGKERFDVWYGENEIWRAACETPVRRTPARRITTEATIRCPRAQQPDGTLQWSGPPHWVEPFLPKKAGDPTRIENVGAHGDSGDLEFDLTVSEDACPLIYASDGGVFVNRPALGKDCQAPTTFEQPASAPRALWLWGMAGANLPDGRVALHFGVQDDGAWATADARGTPTWQDGSHPDSFSHVADANRHLWNDGDGLKIASPGSVPANETFLPLPIATQADGTSVKRQILLFGFSQKIDQFRDAAGNRQYAVLTAPIDLDGDKTFAGPGEAAAVFVTVNFGSFPLVWRSLGSPPDQPCAVRTSLDPLNGRAVIYVQVVKCLSGAGGGRLYRYVEGNQLVPWRPVDPDGELTGGIDLFAVDPVNADRLYVSNISIRCANGSPICDDPVEEARMMFSNDGGSTWQRDTELEDKMVGKGLVAPDQNTFKFLSQGKIGNAFTAEFLRSAQPSLLAFDPYNADVIVAGGQDSGVFLTADGGATWHLLTDPISPGPGPWEPSLSIRPHIPRPYFAHFKHDPDGIVWIYIGSHGRGVWRLRVELPPRRGQDLRRVR